MTAGHLLHPSILREYDIRGIVGETLSVDDALAIGCAFATMVAEDRGPTPEICLGVDGRLTSPALEAALAEGMVSAGASVLRVGRGPTPMLYFGVHYLQADAGVMVTGSHNPPEHNGFKFMLGSGSFYGNRLKRLGDLAAEGVPAADGGQVEDVDVFDAYVEALAAAYRGRGRLKVVWDPGNGASGDVVQALGRRLPGRHDVINGDIDGTFPSHHPDPTVAANLVQLQRHIGEGSHDIGIALDGDGDRIGVLADRGR
ncbi:MAG: phosphomannomutase, partial [Rhodospirillaceae bacterium]|nr:phosphomannomutase [Rhodospirillaceae bacterium]